jgi:hypothetical protein
MNRECHGTLLRLGSSKFYVCLWDGRAIQIKKKSDVSPLCPLCGRRAEPTHGRKYQVR